MYVTDSIRLLYGAYFVAVCGFFIWFIRKVRRPAAVMFEERQTGMDRREKLFFAGLIVVIVVLHVVTLSNLVPWQKWRLWSAPKQVKRFDIEISGYEFKFPEKPMTVQQGQFVEFALRSRDVTYGFGVFRKDGSLVFQLQVLPGYTNRFVWNFSEPGDYDVRSTEFSGPRHSEMIVRNAIRVSAAGGQNE